MYSLVLYDTTNYIDFPIGGQLTSVRNFLTYMSEQKKEYCAQVLLVGLTTDEQKLGRLGKVKIGETDFSFFPVVYRDTNLREVKNSLRIEFLKGLFRFRKQLPHGKNVLHYIHTPEAFIQIKLCHPAAKTVLFSHGSCFNMVKGFRFFQDNTVIKKGFDLFLKWMVKHTNLHFVLDDDTVKQYGKYSRRIVKVNNSVILPDEDIQNRTPHDPVRLLFVGRLSKVKRVDEIIKAAEACTEPATLTIAGDGEEREYLESLVHSDRIVFKGALKPEHVKEEMLNSDILVLNSILEGKPMTIIEAMSYGLPIVTTNVGGINELVRFGENAMETDGKEKSIALAVTAVLKNYRSFSQKSLELSKAFDYRAVNRNIFEKLQELQSC